MASQTESGVSAVGDLECSDHQLRLLLDSVRDYAIYLLDADGRVATWSKGAEHLKGYRAKEVIGRHVSIFLTPEDAQGGKAERELRIAAETGRFEDENWRVRKDGSRFWANVVITALRDENGQLIGFAKITRDLSERKKMEEALRAAQVELEQRVRDRTGELEQANAALQSQLAARKEAQEAIRALSTPVLPVRERLLILPIIGIVDSQRALQLTAELLNAIRSHRAKAAVIDITGVPLVDSKVANHILQTVEAARLMGAEVIVTGISPEISQTLVRIGVDLSRLRTIGDLRGGLEAAEQLLGYSVVRRS